MSSALAHTPTLALSGLFQHSLETVSRWLSGLLTPEATHALTVQDEADRLRAMADDVLKTDPAFAQDLYAAAERCERAARL